MNNLVTISAIESALINNDLSKLTSQERVNYYKSFCESVGLNPLTQPLDFIVLNGKLTLYAKRGATDQLRTLRKVSILKLEYFQDENTYQVTAYARNGEGREDSDMGIVDITGLRGDKLANAKLKAVTKAKRRVTLSICGLGLLDETEVETIPREVMPEAPGPAENFLLDEAPTQDSSEFVCKTGKYKGQAIGDLNPYELDSYINFLRDGAKSKGRPLSGDWLELVENAEVYLSQVAERKNK